MVRRSTRAVGAAAEQVACDFLNNRGLKTIARNFRCRLGEIDLIMRHRDCLVFVEVRYRGGRRIATAGITVDGHKQRKLIRTAALFLAGRTRSANSTVRFDVVAIDVDQSGRRTIEWIRVAFRPGDASL